MVLAVAVAGTWWEALVVDVVVGGTGGFRAIDAVVVLVLVLVPSAAGAGVVAVVVAAVEPLDGFPDKEAAELGVP